MNSIYQAALKAWWASSGIEERWQAIEPERIEAAEAFFKELSTINDEEAERGWLAFGRNTAEALPLQPKEEKKIRKDNTDLTVWILKQIVSRAYREDAVSEMSLVEWLLFVCQYGEDPHLFEAHGKLLQGLLLLEHRQDLEARQALEEAVTHYNDVAGNWHRSESVCQFLLAISAGNVGEFVIAKMLLEKARSLAMKTTHGNDEWLEQIQSETELLSAQESLVTELSRASSREEVRKIAATHPALADDRTQKILRTWAFKAGATGQFMDAIRLASVDDWLEKSPGETSCFRAILAETAAYYNAYKLAEKTYRNLLEEFPESVEYRGGLGHVLVRQGQYEEAREIFTKVIEQSPKNAAALLGLAEICIHRRDSVNARHYLKAAKAADPANPMPETLLRQLEDAGAGPSVILDPVSKTLTISEELLQRPGDDLGIMVSAAVVRNSPQASELLKSLAADKGEEYARKVAELAFPSAQEAQGHYNKAEQLFREGRHSAALKEYELAIAEDRHDAQSYMGAGDCYYHMGKFDLAAAFFEESVAIKPLPSTLRFLGDAHLKAGRSRQAMAAYERAVQVDPTYAPARQSLQIMRSQMRQKNGQ